MGFSGTRCFAPTELRNCSGSWLYKHLVPLGPQTTTIKNGLVCREHSRNTTLERNNETELNRSKETHVMRV